MIFEKMKITKTGDKIREYYEYPNFTCGDAFKFVCDTQIKRQGNWEHDYYTIEKSTSVMDLIVEDWENCSIQIDLIDVSVAELCEVLEFLEDAEVVDGFDVSTVTDRCYQIINGK